MSQFDWLGLRLPRLIRAGGVYLITGGLGRIGTTLARHLITTAGAKVGLTTRGRELPKRSLNLANEFPDQVLVIEACAEKRRNAGGVYHA